MKKRFLILTFILFQFTQVFAQYRGGNGDGHDNEIKASTTLENLSLVILYRGGNGDGHDVEGLLNTTLTNISLAVLYRGGNGDGHDVEGLLNTTLENITLAILYQGGNGDGHDNEILANTTLENISLAVLFRGGNGDGHDVEGLLNTTLENISLAVLYNGGNGDGHDVESLLNTTLENISLAVLYQGGNGDGFDVDQENLFLDPNQVVDLRLAVNVFLQGPRFNPSFDGLMNDDLRSGNLIPKISPYDSGTVISNSNVFNNGGISGFGLSQNDIVDWVFIQIRSGSDDTLIVDDASALVQRDGDVVAIDGTSDVILRGLTGEYYVVIKHRNHLAAMTSNKIPLSVNPTSVNFTSSGTATFGSNAQVQLSNGDMALWAGNVNNDIIVQYSGTTPDTPSILSEILNDAGNFLNFPTYSLNGYNTHDVNMDGNTQYTGTAPDTPFILQNVLAHPGNFLNFSTYQIQEQLPEN
ncbi:hypothetical protein IMCC3317_20790 [Kordia antarctica]|uniref:Uncharacterized protein n=1 Tax=Kordia antarctica TaxID=1218801 RepID=A0A7L4ZLA7_9FLAO|nr:hypothetical protein [Kordia antarctica]QHI36714.1 hypothetical protein IMCC3317_20790 [Kordia antarctica]